MRQLIFFVLLCSGFQSFAETPLDQMTLEYSVDSVRVNPNLDLGKSKIVVRINNRGFSKGSKILYGYDNEGFEALLDRQKSFEFLLDSGEHFFQFFATGKGDKRYAEITTLPIGIESGTTTYLSVDFKMLAPRHPQMHVRKPVIYLYPSQKMDVSVVVKAKGELSFTYPEYLDKWECTALPSGEIIINEDSYNYLFWEAEQTIEQKELNQTEGKVVAKDDLVSFLESALDDFGFNSKEKMDFITFWAPQMIQYEATEIRFMFNEECDFFADLDIEPSPDNLLRFYMIWNPTDTYYLDDKVTLEIPSQTRSGFTVLEWGGMEIPRGIRPE